MQKKLLALAVAGALAPAAAMAQSSVEIYGRLNLGVDSWKQEGAEGGSALDFDRRTRVYDGSSRVGFRVNEALGGGMRAFGVIETGVNVDTGNELGQSGTANANTGFWASRDSYAGIGGAWGDVRFGRQSVWWSNGVIAQTGANYINTAVDGMINDPGLLAIPSARTSNVVSYNSPTFGGFNASLSYGASGGAAASGGVAFTGTTSNTESGSFTGTDQERNTLLGVTGRYTSGALRAQVDWARNSNIGFFDGRDNTGLKIGVGWAYAPGSQISGIWGNLKNDSVPALAGFTTAGDDIEQNFWLINWEHMLGPWQLLAQYFRSDEVEGLANEEDTGATGFTLAAKYFLSKRTGVYASYSKIKNDARSFADSSGAGMSSVANGGMTPAQAGADVTLMAIGVMHNF